MDEENGNINDQNPEDQDGQVQDEGALSAEDAPEAQEEGGIEEGTSDIGFILDIPLELSVELGRSKMLVIDLLGLSQGSIVELDKLAGEPLEIFINRKLVARGEVVVVNEKFGVRLTDIITPMERVRSLAAS